MSTLLIKFLYKLFITKNFTLNQRLGPINNRIIKGNMLKKTLLLLFITCLITTPVLASDWQQANLAYKVCFTPGGECTNEIVNTVKTAKKQVLVQAYQLTSAPIAWALVDAHRRGIDVRVILDKSQERGKRGQPYSPAKFLQNQGIPVWIDYKPAIAHNKVMIIDNAVVITGSFNFSKAAQQRNAENLLILKDAKIAGYYSDNWRKRLDASTQYNLIGAWHKNREF